MAKLLKTLCKELDLEQDYQYFEYLIESKINGNYSQLREGFKAMKKDDQRTFLNDHLGMNVVDQEVKHICIEELTN